MSDLDETLVEEVETVIGDAMGEMFSLYFSEKPDDFEMDLARAVLAHLAATGRLVGEGEERCCDLHNAHCYDVEEICCRACPGMDGSISNPRRVGQREERVEWGFRTPNMLDSHNLWTNYGPRENTARIDAAALGLPLCCRTVRTWTTPDGATGTLAGPWVEVG